MWQTSPKNNIWETVSHIPLVARLGDVLDKWLQKPMEENVNKSTN